MQNAGWNELSGGICVTGTLIGNDLRKDKLTVTATSANNWALAQQNGSARIGYKLKAANADENETTFWEFTSLSGAPETQTLGVDVDDYNNAPIGHYTDTVTFTAAVVKAYSVNFNNNGHGTTPTPETQYVAAGKAPVLTELETTNENLDFAGWYKDQACTQAWSASDTVTGPMTLYAKWTAEQKKTLTITKTLAGVECVYTIPYNRNDTWGMVMDAYEWNSVGNLDCEGNGDNDAVYLFYQDFVGDEMTPDRYDLTYGDKSPNHGGSVLRSHKVADFVASYGSNNLTF